MRGSQGVIGWVIERGQYHTQAGDHWLDTVYLEMFTVI